MEIQYKSDNSSTLGIQIYDYRVIRCDELSYNKGNNLGTEILTDELSGDDELTDLGSMYLEFLDFILGKMKFAWLWFYM